MTRAHQGPSVLKTSLKGSGRATLPAADAFMRPNVGERVAYVQIRRPLAPPWLGPVVAQLLHKNKLI